MIKLNSMIQICSMVKAETYFSPAADRLRQKNKTPSLMLTVLWVLALWLGAWASLSSWAQDSSQEWSATFAATSSNSAVATQTLTFKTVVGASDDYEASFDVAAAPAPQVFLLDLTFPATGSNIVTRLTTDARAPSASISWQINLRADQDGGALTWDVSSIPNSYQLLLMSPPRSTLIFTDMDTITVSIIVQDASIFSINDTVIIGQEEMRVSGIDGNNLTVIRGVNNTVASNHTIGSTITYTSTLDMREQDTISYEASNGNTQTYTVEAISVHIPDANLKQRLADSIGKSVDEVWYSTDLASLTGYLRLTRAGITDLTGLEYCTNVVELHLGGNQISDLTPLANLTNLQILRLGRNQISDISPLANLTNLTRLRLGSNRISDLSQFTNLTNLISLADLNLHNNQISDASPLSALNQLVHLNLSGNSQVELGDLSGLTQLEELYLESNNYQNLDPIIDGLSQLTALDRLDLDHNQLTNLDGIEQLADLNQLQHLYIRYNQLQDISAISALNQLTTLHLERNQISDISAIEQLVNLGSEVQPNQMLPTGWTESLPNNPPVQPKSELSSAETDQARRDEVDGRLAQPTSHDHYDLDLRQNQITNILPLVNNSGLDNGDRITIRYNRLNQDELNRIPELTARGVQVEYDDLVAEIVEIPDPNLKQQLANQLNQNAEEDFYNTDLLNIRDLRLYSSNNEITDLTGLEHCLNLRELYIYSHPITDFSPLASLSHLWHLTLRDIPELNSADLVEDLAAAESLRKLDLSGITIGLELDQIAKLTDLQWLVLDNCQLTEIDPLANLTDLRRFEARNNQITEIEAIASFNELRNLDLSNNQIVSLQPLANLAKLDEYLLIETPDGNYGWHYSPVLNLEHNQIQSIQSLVDNISLNAGRQINLRNNPLSSLGKDQIGILQGRGVHVVTNDESLQIVDIPDANLKRVLCQNRGISLNSAIQKRHLMEIVDLSIAGHEIMLLTGLEYCQQLKNLDLSNNPINDFSFLSQISRRLSSSTITGIGNTLSNSTLTSSASRVGIWSSIAV